MQQLNLLTLALLALVAACKQAPDNEPGASHYQEPHRPQFHFSPEKMWMNDPNGLVFYEGEYHLFYQYYPDSTVWGPMHWGHAVSTDLLHWEHLPIALYPDSLGYIFSGSAVVDWNNSSGFGKDSTPPLVAIFTYHNMPAEKAGKIDFQYQAIAYSNDKGRTWTKYSGNPVVPNPGLRDFRDPKVFWHEPSHSWIMAVAAWDHLEIYASPNLKNWQKLSEFGKNWGTHAGVWECPDLFPATVEGTGKTKWVLIQNINPGAYQGGSGTQYFVGNFDGKAFTVDPAFAKDLGVEPAYVPNGEIFADFEDGTFNGWTSEGSAWGAAPVDIVAEVPGALGHKLLRSNHGGDAATGTLKSPEFTIAHDYINFLVGGGNDKLRLLVQLIVDGKALRATSGTHRETLLWNWWDVSQLKGKTAHIELVDNSSGGWGHLNVDHFLFADEKAHSETEKAVWLDYGRDNYAGVTWSDAPDGRRIFIGWMSNWDYGQQVPTHPWRSAMTIPRELSLKQTDEGLRLFQHPLPEMKNLRTKTVNLSPGKISGEVKLEQLDFPASQMELVLEFDLNGATAREFGVKVSNSRGEYYLAGVNTEKQLLFSDRTHSGKTDFSPLFANRRHTAPLPPEKGKILLHLFLDRASCEIFLNDGERVMTEIFFPNEDYTTVSLFAEGGSISLLDGAAHRLEGIW